MRRIILSAATDRRLSFRARGLLLFLAAHPDMTTDAAVLAGYGTEGRDAIRTAMRELEAAGYVVRTRALEMIMAAGSRPPT